uniref:Uncharacterized protein n=1 Tax=Cacopsylla melanoneura TaxID=428564 RepID=A0A8D8SKL2_9HEMI
MHNPFIADINYDLATHLLPRTSICPFLSLSLPLFLSLPLLLPLFLFISFFSIFHLFSSHSISLPFNLFSIPSLPICLPVFYTHIHSTCHCIHLIHSSHTI